MKQFRIFGVIFFSGMLFLSSCLKTNEDEVRTLAIEQEEIADYLSALVAEGYDVDTTESGVYYVVREMGEGPSPVEGDTISVKYAGYFTNGNLFDTSEWQNAEGIMEFVFITNPMIPGFQDGLRLMNKGAKCDLIIPSSLGYGAYGYNSIPGYTGLVFVVSLEEIKPAL